MENIWLKQDQENIVQVYKLTNDLTTTLFYCTLNPKLWDAWVHAEDHSFLVIGKTVYQNHFEKIQCELHTQLSFIVPGILPEKEFPCSCPSNKPSACHSLKENKSTCYDRR